MNAIDSYSNTVQKYFWSNKFRLEDFRAVENMEFALYYIICHHQKTIFINLRNGDKDNGQDRWKNYHHIFCFPTENKLSPHKKSWLGIGEKLSNSIKIDIFTTLYIILCDNMGQVNS